MDQSFRLDRLEFSDGSPALAAAGELQVELRDTLGGGMQPLLLVTIFASPLFWIVLFWWMFS